MFRMANLRRFEILHAQKEEEKHFSLIEKKILQYLLRKYPLWPELPSYNYKRALQYHVIWSITFASGTTSVDTEGCHAADLCINVEKDGIWCSLEHTNDYEGGRTYHYDDPITWHSTGGWEDFLKESEPHFQTFNTYALNRHISSFGGYNYWTHLKDRFTSTVELRKDFCRILHSQIERLTRKALLWGGVSPDSQDLTHFFSSLPVGTDPPTLQYPNCHVSLMRCLRRLINALFLPEVVTCYVTSTSWRSSPFGVLLSGVPTGTSWGDPPHPLSTLLEKAQLLFSNPKSFSIHKAHPSLWPISVLLKAILLVPPLAHLCVSEGKHFPSETKEREELFAFSLSHSQRSQLNEFIRREK